MTDPPPSECQICGAAPVEKVLYPAAIHFKGSGFYSTDYGRGGRKKEGARDGDKPDSGSPAKDKPTDKTPSESKKSSGD
jgi:predicted nucleic acid-binding Zn ribbon protein